MFFETAGTLSLATSYDGEVYSSVEISSSKIYTISKAEYFKIVANETSAKIESVVVNYSTESGNNSNSSSNDDDSSENGSSQTSTSATINVKTNTIADNAMVEDVASYLVSENIEIKSVTWNSIFGGDNAARLRFTSNNNTGSLTIEFKNPTFISGVTLGVGQYKDKTSGVKVATSANTEGQTLTLSAGVSSLEYTEFNNDTVESTSLTISSTKGNQFYLYSISLTLGKGVPVPVTGINVNPTALINWSWFNKNNNSKCLTK